ncbi:unnamed protein product [Adineta ricciae]|uniref:Uncharacterized protein n=1 Tax=Adineta ricciae TaxID=249248 RepID=A0A813X447_ADIRI|nr:unnamed protein product [Adineta ricciae]
MAIRQHLIAVCIIIRRHGKSDRRRRRRRQQHGPPIQTYVSFDGHCTERQKRGRERKKEREEKFSRSFPSPQEKHSLNTTQRILLDFKYRHDQLLING